MAHPLIFLVDVDRPSYVKTADLSREALNATAIPVHEEPSPAADRGAMAGASGIPRSAVRVRQHHEAIAAAPAAVTVR